MGTQTKSKLLLITALISLGVTGSAMADDPATPEAVTVNGGSLHFTGEIVNAACAVDNDSDGQTIKLGQFRAASLAKTGDESDKVPFTIKLTDCDLGGDATTGAYSTVAVTFSGTEAGTNNKAIAVSGTSDGTSNTADAAQNVGVEILQDGTALTIDGSAASTAKNIQAGSNTLAFSAAYVAIADGVTAGTANADATFKLTYE